LREISTKRAPHTTCGGFEEEKKATDGGEKKKKKKRDKNSQLSLLLSFLLRLSGASLLRIVVLLFSLSLLLSPLGVCLFARKTSL
jgi:hypothetical protein